MTPPAVLAQLQSAKPLVAVGASPWSQRTIAQIQKSDAMDAMKEPSGLGGYRQRREGRVPPTQASGDSTQKPHHVSRRPGFKS
jgi:hypothetical protein